MKLEDRINAIADFGFTERQARFLDPRDGLWRAVRAEAVRDVPQVYGRYPRGWPPA